MMAAIDNHKKICETHLKGRYHIDIVDLLKHPEIAARDQIFAVPALMRKLPEPVMKFIGNLSEGGKGGRRA